VRLLEPLHRTTRSSIAFPADGTFAVPSTTSVVKGSRNLNAARLMADFTLSLEAQKLWPESGVYAAPSDVDPPLGSPPIDKIKVSSIDYEYLKAQSAAAKKRFSEIFSI
jgi:iron(III) transport system substrate-binding protein